MLCEKERQTQLNMNKMVNKNMENLVNNHNYSIRLFFEEIKTRQKMLRKMKMTLRKKIISLAIGVLEMSLVLIVWLLVWVVELKVLD